MRLKLGLMAVLLVGCPRSISSSDAGDAGTTEDFEPELRLLLARFGAATHANDQDLELRRIRAALRQGRLAIDRSVLAACVASRESAVFPSAGSDPDPTRGACAGLWVPRTPNGAACDTSVACVDGFCERPTSFSPRCGSCSAGREEGASCSDGAPCRIGLICQQETMPPFANLCRRASAGSLGQPCPCQAGLSCLQGKCGVAPLPLGAACGSGMGSCEDGLWCINDRCGVLDEGAPCQFQSGCRPGATCRIPDPYDPAKFVVGNPGRCVTGSAGMRCTQDEHCSAGLVCGIRRWRGLCVPKAEANASCEYERQCPAGYACSEGSCRRRVAAGDACDATTTCMVGTLCVAGHCSRLPRAGEPCRETCNGASCLNGTCVAGLGSTCMGLLDACGPTRHCANDLCAAAASTSASCDPMATPCEGGGLCESGQCQAACVLGDGRATDDFFGAADASVAVEPCVPTGPAEAVIPLTEAQAQCVFAGNPSCVGCHSISGCVELRPRSAPPPPINVPVVNLGACGIDAGR